MTSRKYIKVESIKQIKQKENTRISRIPDTREDINDRDLEEGQWLYGTF